MSKVDQIIKIAKRELTPVGHHGETGSYISGLIEFAEEIEKLYSTPLVSESEAELCRCLDYEGTAEDGTCYYCRKKLRNDYPA